MDKQYIESIISKIEKENSVFAKKSYLDSFLFPTKIVGRKKQAEEIIRLLLGYKQSFVVPFISVYGRSGSGKSVTVKFVCENIPDISYCFVNLRQAKTVFGAANLILAELGKANLKSAQGINLAVENIGNTIESVLKKENKKLFVLVLDEFDILFYDKRGKPSDFIYKLMVLAENLRAKGFLLCIIGISNNVLSDYEIDDRVRSRIGSTEIFFESYSKSDVLDILKERAKEAFSEKIDDKVLEYCAKISSAEHGDARRAIDLLRVAAEIASKRNQTMVTSHVDLASEQLQQDRVSKVLSTASYHFKTVCVALARITYLTGQDWYSTSMIHKQYLLILPKETKPLGYRRISELLTELENTGLVVAQTSSKGRHGYGTQYKLVVSPEIVGMATFPEFWKEIVKRKAAHEYSLRLGNVGGSTRSSSLKNLRSALDDLTQRSWDQYVGLD